MALCPHLKLLKEDGMAKLGLRVTLDSDQVGSDVFGGVIVDEQTCQEGVSVGCSYSCELL